MTRTRSTTFQRIWLPGLAFKAVVIGGGYATGRELASFFLPSGPWGGLFGMLLATAIWSTVCALTFLLALGTQSFDYRTFFKALLGPIWPVFEIAYLLALTLILAVFAAAAGAIGEAVFGLPTLAGVFVLMVSIMFVVSWGNAAVERLFKYVSILLYMTYAVFLILGLTHFGERTLAVLARPTPTTGWAEGGLSYAGYNVIGAAIILPVARHLRTPRDAVIAGALAGPLAMLPALLFFICMIAFYPEIRTQTLPSDFLLTKLNLPAFRLVFQLMIFAALLESATGGIHAINERVAQTYLQRRGRVLPKWGRLLIAGAILTLSVFAAARFGLVALIASGYRGLSFIFLAVYVAPLLTLGVWKLFRFRRRGSITEAAPVRR